MKSSTFFFASQVVVFLMSIQQTYSDTRCSTSKLQYLSGDALTDSQNCIGPDGVPYPSQEVERMARKFQGRQGRSLSGVQNPFKTREELLAVYSGALHGRPLALERRKRATNSSTSASASATAGCVVGGAPPRLCKSSYNTTAPMYGVSLTSGQPVTIVQKFPDLLQQVIYETCDSKECDILHGECIQTYVPYLFLVIPLGPVTLTGQDYVLVESGCTCRPKYATPGSDPNPSDVIPSFN